MRPAQCDSHSLPVGAILHVLYAEPDKTLAGVADYLSDPRRPINTTLNVMMTTAHLSSADPHLLIASAAREFLNKSDNERSGVLSTDQSNRLQEFTFTAENLTMKQHSLSS
jgi:type IV secretion system protein VirD4